VFGRFALRAVAALLVCLSAWLLAGRAGAGNYSTLLHGPQCRSYHHGKAALPYWARQRKMTVLVDSVLLGGGPQLRAARPCWRVHLRGRPALMIRVAERELRASHRRVAPLVVIGLGYNSLWERHRRHHRHWATRFDAEALRLLRTLRHLGARQFVWVTLRHPTRATVPAAGRRELSLYAWYFPYVNERLRRLDRRRKDLVLADWEAVSRRRGLTYDSIHLNQRGARLMARTIRGSIYAEAKRQASGKHSGRWVVQTTMALRAELRAQAPARGERGRR
jgi:hypothetical protein